MINYTNSLLADYSKRGITSSEESFFLNKFQVIGYENNQLKYGACMKFKLMALSATLLLLGGCSTTFSNYYGNFKSECRNLPENYINQEYIEEYRKSKTIFFEESREYCYGCTLLVKNERWNSIEIYLFKSERDFPFQNEGLYKIYRNYNLNNCIQRGITDPIYYENDKGKFCLTAELIKERTADFSYRQLSNIKHKTETSKIRETITSIQYNKKTIIQVKSFSFNSPSMHDSCSIEDTADTIIWKDFSY